MYEQSLRACGPLELGSGAVRYRPTLDPGERRVLDAFGAAILVTSVALLAWVLSLPFGGRAGVATVAAVVLMAAVETLRIVQSATLWTFARHAVDPVPVAPRPGLRVAILTTIVPSKEPLDMVLFTLRAMRRIRYDGAAVDVWLLDEADDPLVRAACERIGVHHFSRRGRAGYATPSGPFRAGTKHGNHNAWRSFHERDYDIVAQMDPDHVPVPEFLQRTIGYFGDPDVAFVVAPQVYGNQDESWIAQGAAFQSYVFHGVIQRGANGLGAPLLIGTNHLYRVAAFHDIGGYQPSQIEDHLTALVLYRHEREDGRRWRGVYTPDVLAVGQGPTSFTDYFSQQQRWALGIWEIVRSHSPRVFPGLRPGQRLSFAMLQSFYPSMALSWLLTVALTAVFLSGTVDAWPIWPWLILWPLSVLSTLGLFLWLRRFNIAEHERRDRGWRGMSLLLLSAPVYVRAMVLHLLRRDSRYVVTAKGNLTSPDSLGTFRSHLRWGAALAVLLTANLAGWGSSFPVTRGWLLVPLIVCVAPPMLHLRARLAVPARPAPRPVPRVSRRSSATALGRSGHPSPLARTAAGEPAARALLGTRSGMSAHSVPVGQSVPVGRAVPVGGSVPVSRHPRPGRGG